MHRDDDLLSRFSGCMMTYYQEFHYDFLSLWYLTLERTTNLVAFPIAVMYFFFFFLLYQVCKLFFINYLCVLMLISVIFAWFLLSSYLLKLLVFLYFFWFDLIFIYMYLFICALKEWEDFRLIYKGFTCKVGLGQLNQVNLHPARHEF